VVRVDRNRDETAEVTDRYAHIPPRKYGRHHPFG
jgi:hypothetical protein